MTNARITLSTTQTAPEQFARELRSLAAKVDAGALTPGADLKIGNTRVQVAVPQEDPIRKFAREQGIPVGTRGRFSKALIEAFEAHQKEERRKAREARAAKRAAKEAVAV